MQRLCQQYLGIASSTVAQLRSEKVGSIGKTALLVPRSGLLRHLVAARVHAEKEVRAGIALLHTEGAILIAFWPEGVSNN